jgi:hypothetical protein
MGALFHYAIPLAVHRLGWLGQFYTDIWAEKPLWKPLQAIPLSLRTNALKRFLGRSAAGLPSGLVTQFPLLAMQNAIQYKRARNSAEILMGHMDAGRRFCENILRCGIGDCSAVYTTNTQGLDLLIHARQRGWRTFMEQVIAPYSMEMKLLHAEQERFPRWETPIEQTGQAGRDYAELERQEWANSDRILCGSEFVQDSIREAGGPADRCVVVPYGFDFLNQKSEIGNRKSGGPLRVLTVGTVCLRKGMPYVAKAAEALRGQMTFRVVGPCRLLPTGLEKLRSVVELVGAVPRSEVLDHFKWADVFLLPSLCEGSATVCYEALAMGLPVICTHNTGSVVRNNIDGFIIPVGNVDAMIERLVQLDNDRDLLLEMSRNAVAGSGPFSMEDYALRLRNALVEADAATVPAAPLK